MNILLDTHILLWCLYEPDKLPVTARQIITDPDNWICCSSISLWECELKHLKHPEVFSITSEEIYEDCIQSGYIMTDLHFRHIIGLHTIPVPQGLDHKDPFDKMLISQARTDHMLFLTHDSKIREYNIPCIKYV